ncbi:TIGR03085 family protein, partial [Actinotalea ferrariae]|nr:TIGR03085 family protein [Actinotalea ferrariae]
VVLSTPEGEARVARATERGDVVVRGALDDVVLHAFGRRGAAAVELEGDDAAVAALATRA